MSWPWSQAERGAGGLAALRARGAARAHLDLLARHDGRLGLAARGRARASTSAASAALRRLVRPLTRVAGASLSSGSSSYFTLVLRWAGCLDGGLAGVPPARRRSSFYAKSDYFDKPARPARPRADDRLDRAPPAHAVARLGRAAPRRLRRRAQPAGRRTPRRSCTATCSSRSSTSPTSTARPPGRASRRWINGVWRALRPHVSGEAYQNYIDPRPRALAARVLRVEPRAPARDQEAGGPGLPLPLPAGDPAGALMDRDSLRRLRAQPGYLRFVSRGDARARVRRDVLGGRRAARARPHRQRRARGRDGGRDHVPEPGERPAARRVARPHRPAPDADGDRPARDRDACSWRSCCSSATRPNWVIPLVVVPAGITYPLSFGGFTSMIPALVPGELLPPANALETTSFNAALVIGPALAGTLSAVVAPGDAAARGGGARARRAGADRADPRPRPAAGAAPGAHALERRRRTACA